MSSVFEIKEHVIDASHIREFARATGHSQEEVLRLAVKQYVPRDNPDPRPGDVTIIGAHANGFPKELYEALWEDLHGELKKRDLRIRGIWIADCAWQGQSGVLNEAKLGNDPGWFDYTRDILHMINHFRRDMPRPLVGVAHSFGANVLASLALIHPRLLSTLVLLDPVISLWSSTPSGLVASPAAYSLYRRDLWPSREEAIQSFGRSPFYAAWDPRVLASWTEHGLRDTPTQLYPDENGGTTLTTTKHHEVFTFFRPSWDAYDSSGTNYVDRSKAPDLDPTLNSEYPTYPFYRSEGGQTLHRLPHLRPSVLYIIGGQSPVSLPKVRRWRMELTGTGAGGSGGVSEGKVEEICLDERGHLIPMEAPGICARHAAEWIAAELVIWRREQDEYLEWTKKSTAEKTTLSEDWKRLIARPTRPEGKSKI